MILERTVRQFVRGAIVTLMVAALSGGRAQTQQADQAGVDIQTKFASSGWMGDGEYGRKYIQFFGADRSNPHTRPESIKITYKFGPARWGGIYWQNAPDNWGDVPGNNYSGKGFSKVSFWARGEHGGEVVEFKAGGIERKNKQYRDSFSATTGRLTLTRDWKPYTIDLAGANLSSVIGGFCWVASADYNQSKQITFFLDDLIMQ